MKNILYLSGSDQFPRVKMGVGHKPEGWDLADWVLSRFSDAENKALEEAIAHAVEAVSLIVAGDTEEGDEPVQFLNGGALFFKAWLLGVLQMLWGASCPNRH